MRALAPAHLIETGHCGVTRRMQDQALNQLYMCVDAFDEEAVAYWCHFTLFSQWMRPWLQLYDEEITELHLVNREDLMVAPIIELD